MKNAYGLLFTGIFFGAFLIGCASTSSSTSKIVVWEEKEIARKHEVLGPVSITQELDASGTEMIQGLAQYLSRDGRVSSNMPPDMKAALDAKMAKYRESAFDALAKKAREYDADAVIAAEYTYTPPFVTFSKKAMINAKGTMIKY